ncbi:hypothetical protein F8S09_02915 [Deinococcus sp. SDU3-2]|uniref:Uncharacterized protein n=1 Tax=Deinococcus terrestris TaxID=2651870 RepID=A0A7X1NTN5_9DEIO|nr:hypothetical protein [Deinococcus terrestris]MPY65647.1 hypothetical protein [Deinococcus terrestris]
MLHTIAGLENVGELITTARIAAELSLPRQNIRGYLLALREHGLVHCPHRAPHHPHPPHRRRVAGARRGTRPRGS